jgi:hypothetical protein
MIDELADLIKSFSGASNQTCCFNHVVNLVARTIIQQFDILKSQADGALDEAEQELRDLVEGINIEEVMTAGEQNGEQGDEDDEANEEGWIDEWAAMKAKLYPEFQHPKNTWEQPKPENCVYYGPKV